LQRAVHGPGRAALGLQLDDLGHQPPDIRLTRDRPFIGVFGHRGGWRDRIDGEDLAETVGSSGDGLIAIKG